MSALHHFLLATALLAAVTGVLFLAGSAYYLAAYLGAETALAARDHLTGLGIGLRYTFGAFAVAAVCVFPLRRALSRPLVRLLAGTAVVTGGIVVMWQAGWAVAGYLG